jgi:ferredoxin
MRLTGGTGMRRLEIDWTRCDGHGLRAELPGQTTRDEWGFPVLAPRVDYTRGARRGAALCPALALRLESQ